MYTPYNEAVKYKKKPVFHYDTRQLNNKIKTIEDYDDSDEFHDDKIDAQEEALYDRQFCMDI